MLQNKIAIHMIHWIVNLKFDCLREFDQRLWWQWMPSIGNFWPKTFVPVSYFLALKTTDEWPIRIMNAPLYIFLRYTIRNRRDNLTNRFQHLVIYTHRLAVSSDGIWNATNRFESVWTTKNSNHFEHDPKFATLDESWTSWEISVRRFTVILDTCFCLQTIR